METSQLGACKQWGLATCVSDYTCRTGDSTDLVGRHSSSSRTQFTGLHIQVYIVQLKCTMSGDELALHQTFPGTGSQAGNPRISRSRPDRTAPVRQDDNAATCLWATVPPRLAGSAGCSRRGSGRSARVPGAVSTASHLRRGATFTPPASLHQGKDRRAPKSEGTVPIDRLAEKVTESLAGRAAMLRLLPLSRSEAEGRPNASLAWERKR